MRERKISGRERERESLETEHSRRASTYEGYGCLHTLRERERVSLLFRKLHPLEREDKQM